MNSRLSLMPEHGSPALDFVLPPSCTFCRANLNPAGRQRYPEIWLCDACRFDMVNDERDPCQRCGMPVGPYARTDECLACRTRQFRFKQVVRLGVYEGELRRAVIRGKGRGSEALAESLAALLWQNQEAELRSLNVDFVVPVPQHWTQWFTRPHHQARTIAQILAECLGVPVRDRLVTKVRMTRDQSSLHRSKRLQNLDKAFAVTRDVDLERQNVLVVDDILTTGTTANEVTRALRNAHAGRVGVALLAVVPRPGNC